MTLRALIWDVDGTLAETERDGHRVAFNHAFEVNGLARRWDVGAYGRLLEITGGYERLSADLRTLDEAPRDAAALAALARRLHEAKNQAYARLVGDGRIPLRAGVVRLIDACAAAGVVLAIATTTSRGNVDALLAVALGARWVDRFAAVVCAEDAPAKKPDPSVYRIALERIGVEAGEALAVEDSPNGVAAATGAGIAVLVTPSVYFADASFDGAAAIGGLDVPVAWPGGVAPRVDVDVSAHDPRERGLKRDARQRVRRDGTTRSSRHAATSAAKSAAWNASAARPMKADIQISAVAKLITAIEPP